MTEIPDTLLSIHQIPFPKSSARDIRAQLRPIAAGELARAEDGTLVDLTIPEFRKFALTISCDAVWTLPTLAGRWKGATVTVDCPNEMVGHIPTGATGFTLDRDPVPNSIRVYKLSDPDGPDIAASSSGRLITLLEPAPEPLGVTCRMRLTMMLVDWSGSLAEWQADTGWSIDLEEV